MDNIFDQIKNFIIEQRWQYDFPLTKETSLQKDLLIYGDDADEFLLAFGKKFNVDLREFNIAAYFNSEGDPAIRELLQLFKGEPLPKKTLTIGHLIKAIEVGKLNEDVINSQSKSEK